MYSKKEVLEILRSELPYLKKHYGIKKIGVFGSYSKNLQKPESDVDILIEFDKSIGLKFISLCDYLEDLLGKKVDVLTYDGVKSIRVKEVKQDISESVVYA